jgi:hypothetical protein
MTKFLIALAQLKKTLKCSLLPLEEVSVQTVIYRNIYLSGMIYQVAFSFILVPLRVESIV